MGADCILLIIAARSDEKAAGLGDLARSLGTAVLAEVHHRHELDRALGPEQRPIAANNRDSKTLVTDRVTSEELVPLIPAGRIPAAESATRTPDDVRRMCEAKRGVRWWANTCCRRRMRRQWRDAHPLPWPIASWTYADLVIAPVAFSGRFAGSGAEGRRSRVPGGPRRAYIRRVMTAFRKMHGLGNDFVVLDARARELGITPAIAAAISDRRFGVGCDQFIVMESPGDGADAFMRIRNSDGSEAEACGNATRCVASLVAAETGKDRIVVRTVAGDLPVERMPGGLWRADMGRARLGWRDVPLARECDTLHVPLALGPVADPAACSMGNPHATFFVDDLAAIPVAEIGPLLEHHALFPERANIGFAQVLSPERIRLVMWERGAGMTLACGSGACATIVNAARRGLAGRRARVELPGGALEMEWREDGHVLMTGPVATAFTGELDLSRYP